jgi:Pentapeptide repeats (8 copies)
MLEPPPKLRPDDWQTFRSKVRQSWLVPLFGIDWCFDWVAFALSRWAFLEVLQYLGSFSVLVAVIFYFSEAPDRLQQKHYQAWQVINTAQGKGGSGGRIEALEQLNHDKVPLVGVDLSGAFLQGVRLPRAQMVRSNLNAVDARNSSFRATDLTGSDLQWGNFRQSNFSGTDLIEVDLSNADLCSADLSGAKLDDATMDGAELSKTNLDKIQWKNIRSLKGATLWQVRNAPPGFLEWAAQHGADTSKAHPGCE